MRAFVTGAAGFIGSNLSEALINNSWEVIGVDAFTDYYSREIKTANLQTLRGRTAFTFLEGDTRAVIGCAELDDIDVVFHQAGQPGVRNSWSSGFSEYVDLNISATQDLIEKMIAAGSPRLIMASSSSVYGNSCQYPVTEEMEARPYSPYGVTKLAAERLALAYAANFGIDVFALRYFTVYGPRQRPDMAIRRMIESAMTERPFPLYGDGQQVRDFTFVDDVVRANLLAASASCSRGGVVLNVCSGGSTAMSELFQVVGQSVGKPIPINGRSYGRGDVQRTGGSNDRANLVLGWQPRVSIREGIDKQVSWATERSSGHSSGLTSTAP